MGKSALLRTAETLVKAFLKWLYHFVSFSFLDFNRTLRINHRQCIISILRGSIKFLDTIFFFSFENHPLKNNTQSSLLLFFLRSYY